MDEITFRVSTERDTDMRPWHADCFTEEQIAAWRRDEWHFIGVTVDAEFRGISVGSASLWAVVDFDQAHIDLVAEELKEEALADAQTFLTAAGEAAKKLATESALKRVNALIREKYPTAERYGVTSSDQGFYGYLLIDVTMSNGEGVSVENEDMAELEEAVNILLMDMDWGSFGDEDEVSTFDVDMSTNQID